METLNFNPRSLAGATTNTKERHLNHLINFNPRSLAGATLSEPDLSYVPVHFNPRSLAGATSRLSLQEVKKIFQSTLPRGSDQCLGCRLDKANISIHAPSRERRAVTFESARYVAISIHAPSRERLKPT